MSEIWDNERIRQGRKDREITAEDAATQLNVAPEYLSMLENGHRQPSSKLIGRMAEVYQRPVAYFLKTEPVAATA